jgi:hypothetical protein
LSSRNGIRTDQDQHLPEWADPAVPDASLDPQGLSRRGLLKRGGLFGAAFGTAGMFGAAGLITAGPAAAGDGQDDDPELAYLVGDHHVHSAYSHDAKHTFSRLAQRAAQFGLDWMVFTEHSNIGHANAGGAQREHDEGVVGLLAFDVGRRRRVVWRWRRGQWRQTRWTRSCQPRASRCST